MIRSRYKLILGTGRRTRRDHLETDAPRTGPYLRFDWRKTSRSGPTSAPTPALENLRQDLIGAMYDRLVPSWTGPEPIPAGLLPRDAIEWCLSPRDH